jgi:hypothetical protein
MGQSSSNNGRCNGSRGVGHEPYLQCSILFGDSSTTVMLAPAFANDVAVVHIPPPISSTFLPFHLLNSAKEGIWYSTWYFRRVTSSQCCLLPYSIPSNFQPELHGRLSQ